MKRLGLLFVMFALAMCSVGCEGEAANTPEASAKGFLEAMKKKDYEGAKKYADEETDRVIDMVIRTPEGAPGNDGAEIKDVKCDTQGDKSTCTVCCGSKGQETKIELNKVGEEWLVKMSKEQLQKSEGGQ